MRIHRSIGAAAAFVWLLGGIAACASDGEITVGAGRLLGDGPDFFTAGGGMYDIFKEGEVSARTKGYSGLGLLEYRVGRKLAFAGPLFGVLFNSDAGVYGYGGFYLDFAWRSWRLTPILTAGGYRRGQSKELGGVFQFHLGATLSYQFENGTRLGFGLTHISNREVYEENPGVEMAFFSLSLPQPTTLRRNRHPYPSRHLTSGPRS